MPGAAVSCIAADVGPSMPELLRRQNLYPAGQDGTEHPQPVADSATFSPPEASDEDLGDLLLEALPGDGSTIGNQAAREALSRAAQRPISDVEYDAVKDRLLGLGLICKGRGRGGAIGLAQGIERGGRDQAPTSSLAKTQKIIRQPWKTGITTPKTTCSGCLRRPAGRR